MEGEQVTRAKERAGGGVEARERGILGALVAGQGKVGVASFSFFVFLRIFVDIKEDAPK